jgi:hypothetical protein
MSADAARDPTDRWIGRAEIQSGIASWFAAEGLRAIDPAIRSAEGAAPLLSHWAHFLDIVPMGKCDMTGLESGATAFWRLCSCRDACGPEADSGSNARSRSAVFA